MVERLSGADAILLHMDVPGTPMHTLKTVVLDSRERGRPISIDDLAQGVIQLTGLMPRLRQRVRAAPGFPARPFWADDVDFDVWNHLEEVHADPPGDRVALDRIHTRLASERLDLTRPLWSMTLVDGLEGGRQAVVTRIHHAIVDGGGAVKALMRVTDARPTDLPAAPSPPPESPVSDFDLVSQLLREAPRLALDFGSLVVEEVRLRRRKKAFEATHPGLPRPMDAPRVFSSRKRDDSRLCASTELPLDAIRRVARAASVTVNGVYHALIAAAFRDELLARGEELEGTTVSFAIAADDGDPIRVSGNFVAPVFAYLATEEADPVRRLLRTAASCRDAVDRLKLGDLSTTGRWATHFCQLAPWAMRQLAPRISRVPNNVTTANVRGPDHQRWAGGCEVIAWISFAVVVDPANINITAYSYDDRFSIGMLVGHGVLDQPYRFLERMERELEILDAELAASGGKASLRTSA